MPKTKQRKVPSYRLHKPTKQALVTLDGREIYLGLHGTSASRERYDQLIAEWLANGRSPHVSTLWRWARRGVNGVKLTYRRYGRRIVTSLPACEKFSLELAAADCEPKPSSAGSPSTPNHNKALAAAEAELEAAGI